MGAEGALEPGHALLDASGDESTSPSRTSARAASARSPASTRMAIASSSSGLGLVEAAAHDGELAGARERAAPLAWLLGQVGSPLERALRLERGRQ